MTANAFDEDRDACIDAGMDDYISKPFLLEEIVERIRKWGGRYIQARAEMEQQNNHRNTEKPSNAVLDMAVVQRLRDMTAGSDPTFFSNVIAMFVEQGREITAEIEKLSKSEDWRAMSKLAHKLKGSALNIGANLLAEVCRQIELVGESPSPSDCLALLPTLMKEWKKTEEAFGKLS